MRYLATDEGVEATELSESAETFIQRLYCRYAASLLREHGSTDHADLDRFAAGCARRHGSGARRRTAFHPCQSGADHHRPEHRPGDILRRADLPGHRHADVRSEGADRRESDVDAATDSPARRRSNEAREAAPELG